MSETISLDKEIFVDRFLNPVSKLADNIALNIEKDYITTICNSQKSSVVVYARMDVDLGIPNPIKINLPDVSKFIRTMNCIEKTNLKLTLNDNNIAYTDGNDVNFVYYLLEDGYLPKSTMLPEKIDAMEFHSSFDLSISKFNEVIKGCAIVTDATKLYLYTKENEVYAELNDKETPNINSITYLISSSYEGEPLEPALAIKLESLRLIAGIKTSNIKVRYNHKNKVTVFEVKDDGFSVKFMISALVK